MRARLVFFLLLPVLASETACRKLDLKDGFECSRAGKCPAPYLCGNGLCYRNPPVDSAADGAIDEQNNFDASGAGGATDSKTGTDARDVGAGGATGSDAAPDVADSGSGAADAPPGEDRGGGDATPDANEGGSSDCDAGMRRCAGVCVDDSPAHCGNACLKCDDPICSGSDLVGQSTCVAGACMTPAVQACPMGFACSGTGCLSSCVFNTDCRTGYFCASGTCHLAASQIETGYAHSCVVLSDRTARCWGDNSNGQLGNGSTAASSLIPVVVSNLSGVMAIAAGLQHTCALLSGGAVKCWGAGVALGNGSVSGVARGPVDVTGLGSGVSAITAGDLHSCAILSGTVRCWGGNPSGQLGDGSQNHAPTPVTVTGLTGATFISGGSFHTCAATSSGAVCWGDNTSGQLGIGAVGWPVLMPGQTACSSCMPVGVAAGGQHSCLVDSTFQPYCWGAGGAGQIGNGGTQDSLRGLAVNLSVPIRAISAGAFHSCALGQSEPPGAA